MANEQMAKSEGMRIAESLVVHHGCSVCVRTDPSEVGYVRTFDYRATTQDQIAREATRLRANIARTIDAALAAQRERFVGTLEKAYALIADNRALIVECESVGGDESTMDAKAKEALIPFDVVLAEIAGLIGDPHSQAELGHGTQTKTALPDEPAVAPEQRTLMPDA